ncbi:MAG: mechanosensitive ion channel [Bacteroidales bacterium]|nr:mechanosensitive ion channel [Bacteroidales bacterium]
MKDIRFLFNIKEILVQWNFSDSQANILNTAFGIFVIILMAWLSDFLTRRILVSLIRRVAKRTKIIWDDILVERRVFHRLSHLAPALVLHYFAGYVLRDFQTISNIMQGAISIYMVLVTLLVINSVINALHDIYKTFPVAANRSIKGYIQVVYIIVYSLAVILILSILLGKSPVRLLTGIGAMAAVLILVFKDTILGFVASIQLSANNMVKIGDWITMPSRDADGTVLDITLNTVKVQNWDKTISTIPTYALVSESFSNWRGMEESGGRRIKRSISIDMKSVKFCSPEMLEKFKKIIHLKKYIEEKQAEIEKFNKDQKIDESIVVNGRRMTNIGVFRKYLEFYLHNHPKIHDEMTFLVRQLQPTELGVPIEIYVFSKDQQWANYESLQADIFDHVLAVIPEFELRVFQNPSGDDFRKLVQ